MPETEEKEKLSPKSMNVYQKLWFIQTNIKVPKNQYNNFGKYKYRSAEDILTATVPFLKACGAALVLNDELIAVGAKIFVKATAKLIDVKDGDAVESSALAELCEHKGMSLDQCTGTASSYARKYALNALLALNDVQDSDYLKGMN